MILTRKTPFGAHCLHGAAFFAYFNKEGDSVSLDFFKEVAQAEDRAEEILKNAHKECGRIAQEAQGQREAFLAQQRELYFVHAKKMQDERQAAVNPAVSAILAEAQKECAKLSEAADRNLDAAVKALTEKVVG